MDLILLDIMMPGKDGMDLCREIRQFSNMSNRVFSRSELINRVQGYDFEGYDRTIDSHIKNLRKKIAQQLPGQEIISTAYGIGYKSTASSKKNQRPPAGPFEGPFSDSHLCWWSLINQREIKQ